jgi:hypothetical protein
MHESGFNVPDPDVEPAFPRSKFMKLASRLIMYGADMELEACCEWLEDPDLDVDTYKLRSARRPESFTEKEQTKPLNHPPMTTDNHPPMGTNCSLFLVTNCVFSGLPPAPYTHWSDYFNSVRERGVLYGLKISACGSMNSTLKPNWDAQ